MDPSVQDDGHHPPHTHPLASAPLLSSSLRPSLTSSLSSHSSAPPPPFSISQRLLRPSHPFSVVPPSPSKSRSTPSLLQSPASMINNHTDQLGAVQRCCVSVTSSTSLGPSSGPHHHLSLDQQSHFHDRPPSSRSRDFNHGGNPLSPKLSAQSLPHWNGFDSSCETVRHTTKLLKSRDSRTGRLIINQYMKGKELGRGVHGIVYIGKNMDKLIRTSAPLPSLSPRNTSIELLRDPEPLSSCASIGNSSALFHPIITPPGSMNDTNLETTSSPWSEEDYETVAIKVVRREPKGPKSLRRSQMQRQQREAQQAAMALSSEGSSSHSRGSADLNGFVSSDLSSAGGRVPLLKDVDDKLKKEIAIMKRLRHKHIVQLKEVIDDAKSKKVFMILEFMEGGQVLWQDPLTQTPLMTVEQARNTFRQVLLGLEYLHYQGIIHRDIKPANLLWTADRETVKISDFGVSHISGVLKRSASNCNLLASVPSDGLTDESPRTLNSTDDKALRKTEGSPAFMAPELCCPVEATPGFTPPEASALDYFAQRRISTSIQSSNPMDSHPLHTPLIDKTGSTVSRLISLPLSPKTFVRGERPVVGKAIDIWALGVTLFCLLFGRTPFTAPNEYELFNVIWNEPILIPDTMGIEQQPIDFDPDHRHLDGPVQRDSRELVDLLSKLLQKDPRKRIKLEDVKIHPWVLNNLDNTQYWVHETAPVGGDAVYVTTEEVANFSRPRASLTTHKPLFGVKQSLRKAAIKLGLQRPPNSISRIRSKSISSAASGTPSPKVESTFSSSILPHSHGSSFSSSHPAIRQRITINTSNLTSNPRPESPPISPSPLSFSSSTAAHLRRSFGTCSGWPSVTAATSKAPVVLPPPTRPLSPACSTIPIDINPSTPERPARTASEAPHAPSCLSSISSRSVSPSHLPEPPRHVSGPSVPSLSPNIHLSHGLNQSVHAHHPHMLLDPVSFPVDKNNHRRSLPSSPVPLRALALLSRTSLAVPPRTASPAAVSESEGHAKLAPPAWFRDALFRVKQRFTRSPGRRNSHLTDFTASDDFDSTPIESGEARAGGNMHSRHPAAISHRFLEELRRQGSPSEVFLSDVEPTSSHDAEQRQETFADNEADGDEEDDDDDDGDGDDLTDNLLQKPLMYHDGTNWSFPSEGTRLDSDENIGGHHWVNSNGATVNIHHHRSRRDEGAPQNEEDGVKEASNSLGAMELTPRNMHAHESAGLDPILEPNSKPCPAVRNQPTNNWIQPRLTFRPASMEDGRLEYRSSDDDDLDDDDSQSWRWKNSRDGSGCCISSPTSAGSGCPQDYRRSNLMNASRQDKEEEEEEEEEGNNTLQIEVRRRKRGSSKSEGS